MSAALSYPEAIVVGAFQGVTELFPVSSLGHSILIPALVGGRWARDLNVSRPESPYLAFIVGLHVATAVALLVFFWRDWIRVIGGFLTSLRDRRVETPDQPFISAYAAVRYLTRYFQTRTLTPFAVYCSAAGLVILSVR